MKFLSILLPVLLMAVRAGFSQDPQSIQSSCQKELDNISNKVSALNDEYEHIKHDLQNGLFCSDCMRSKTELENQNIDFSRHIAEGAAGGRRVVQATQKQMQDAHAKYLGKYNSLKQQFESRKQSCQERYDAAVQARNEQQQREAERQEEERQQEVQRQQDERQRLQQEQARQQQLEQERAQQALQEFQRQQAEMQQQLLTDIDNNTQDIVSKAQADGQQLKNSISNMNRLAENETIGFRSQTSDTGGSQDLQQLRRQTQSVEDYNTDDLDLDAWHERSLQYLRERNASYEDRQTYNQMEETFGDQESAYKAFGLFDKAKSYYNDLREKVSSFRSNVREFIDETVQEEVESWPDRYVDNMIDTYSDGQVNRNLKFIKGVGNSSIDNFKNAIDAFNSGEEYDADPGRVMRENAITLLPYGETLKDVHDTTNEFNSAEGFKAKVKVIGRWIYSQIRD